VDGRPQPVATDRDGAAGDGSAMPEGNDAVKQSEA
jgi:hypothetical protein